ncbi:MAG: ABC transporter permease, partial [Gemmatimonadota bacterium]
LPEENRSGRDMVAMLSHAHWRQRFGEDPGVIGRPVTINGQQRTIIGVLPPEFGFPDRREMYFPIAYDSRFSSTTADGRRGEYLLTVGRLAAGITAEQAAAEVGQISDRLRQAFPETNSQNISLTITPLDDELLGNVRVPLLILLGAVGLVLLIACVNVANLLLARASAREGELGVRAALGAGRRRLVRQLLTESVILGLAGGIAGLVLAMLATQALIAVRPEGIPRLENVRVDGLIVGFTAAVAIGTGLLFGILPAAQATRSDLADRLRATGRSGIGSRSALRARHGLIIAEMALAIVLLVGSALLIRSFHQLTSVDPGFRTERLVTFDLSLPPSAYADGPSVRQFYPRLLAELGSLPGVESVAGASELPLGGIGNILAFTIEDAEPPPPGFVLDAAVTSVTPDYFSTLGISLRSGRLLTATDGADAPLTVVANEAFARRFFPADDPVGRRITFGGPEWMEIVGVVGDVPQNGLDQGARPALYAPHQQFTTRSLDVAVRTAGDPLTLLNAIRSEVTALDPDLPIERFSTGAQLVSASVAQPRFYTGLLAIFAAVALTLAAVGIFAVMSFLVTQRTREIGVRMALGADPWKVRSLVVRGALALCAIGIGAGVVAAMAGSRLLSGLLYGVSGLDPIAYSAAVLILFAVAFVASYLPARAATRVEPAVALRQQ